MLKVWINIFKFVRKLSSLIYLVPWKPFSYLVYWRNDSYGPESQNQKKYKKFHIHDTGNCNNQSQYGYAMGRPCVLVKMNKVKANNL